MNDAPLTASAASHVEMKCESVRYRLQLLLPTLAVLFCGYFVIGYTVEAKYQFRTFLDNYVSFQPWFYPIYSSLWVFILLPVFKHSSRNYLRFLISLVASYSIGYIFFIVTPGKMLHVSLEEYSSFVKLLYGPMFAIDTDGCLLPSLHAALPVIVIGTAGKQAFRLWWLPWAFLIMISGAFVNQHYVIDIIAGFALGLLCVILVKYLYPD